MLPVPLVPQAEASRASDPSRTAKVAQENDKRRRMQGSPCYKEVQTLAAHSTLSITDDWQGGALRAARTVRMWRRRICERSKHWIPSLTSRSPPVARLGARQNA